MGEIKKSYKDTKLKELFITETGETIDAQALNLQV